MNIKINIEEALKKTKGEKITGVVYIHAFDYKTGSNGKQFASGQFSNQGILLPFKVWSDHIEEFKSFCDKKIVMISGTIDVWKDAVSVVIDKIENDIYGYTPADFLLGHNRHKLETEFDDFVNTILSSNAKALVNLIIEGETRERFFTEFAAKGMHDACPSGLANHTVKMLRLAKTMIDNDNRFIPFSDLIYTGVILHDIGKIKELNMGTYVKNSFVTHRELGCEMLKDKKEEILNLFDEDFYYRLISILQGHHHIYEEKARTIYAYIVHLIDMVDSQCTHLMDSLDSLSYKETSSGEKMVGHHDETFYY